MPSDVELYLEAKAALAAVLATINQMPPGDSSHLADAQNHMAAVRRHLDAWLDEGEPIQGLHER